MDANLYALLKNQINKISQIGDISKITESLNKKLDISGHAPDTYLGTDSEGNIVERENPKYTILSEVDENGVLVMRIENECW